MNPSTIRWLDQNIGVPLCFFLTLHRRLCRLGKSGRSAHKRPAKVLFIKLIEQGSTVLAYPALKKAAELVGKDLQKDLALVSFQTGGNVPMAHALIFFCCILDPHCIDPRRTLTI